MAERDRFELDLATALRRYAEDAPTQIRPLELARNFAAAHPHRGAGIGHWRLVAVPGPAWILLLAALLTALLAGAIFVGSQVQRRLPAVVPPIGQLFECPLGSTPDEPGPVDQARPATWGEGVPAAAMGPIAYDRSAGRIVLLTSSDQGTWTFDVCANTWTQMQSGAGPNPAVAFAYDPGTDLTIGIEGGDAPYAWAYDLGANAWTRKGPAPADIVRLWYDAAAGRVGAWATRADAGPGMIWTYDVASDTWTQVGTLEALGGFPWGSPGNDLLAYDASIDRVVATVVMGDGGVRTRLVDLRTGSVVDARAVAPWDGRCGYLAQPFCYDGPTGTAIAYDDRSERTVVLIGGRMFAYNPFADRWDTLFGPGDPGTSGPQPSWDPAIGALAVEGRSMVYDPVNRRLVVLASGLFGAVDTVLAVDTLSRGWTVLLERSPGPSPCDPWCPNP